MKKYTALLLAAVLMLGLLAGCASSETPTATPAATDPTAGATQASEVANAYSEMTIEELKPLLTTVNEGKLTMVTSPDFAPYEFYSIAEDGTPTLAGFDIALGQYIADFLGLELEVIPMDFDGTISELAAKKADIGMAGYSPDPERERAMNFSSAYYTGGQCFVTTQANAALFSTLADTNKAEYQIGAQLASIQAGLAKENSPEADIVELAKVTDIIAEVLNGKLDGAYMEAVVAETYAKNYPDLAIVLDVPYDAEGSVVGVCKDNDVLLAAVNLAIAAALEDGSMSQFIAEANEAAAGNTYEGLLETSPAE